MTTTTHVRIVNGGTPEHITVQAALAEINNATMGNGRKEVRRMSASRSSASIEYRNGAKVDIRPATDADQEPTPAKPEWRTLKGLNAPFAVYGTHKPTNPYRPIALASDRTQCTGEPITITRLERRGGLNYGYTAANVEVFFSGPATKVWAHQ